MNENGNNNVIDITKKLKEKRRKEKKEIFKKILDRIKHLLPENKNGNNKE